MTELQEIVGKCRDARDSGWAGLSTSEQLMSAIVLDRPEWLREMGYTMAAALRRLGPAWVELIPEVERALHDEQSSMTLRRVA